MPRLTKRGSAFTAALVLACGLLAEPRAHAAEPIRTLRWDVGARVGFAASWSEGQSHLGPGTGLSAGLTLKVPLRFGVTVLYHPGTIVSAENASITFWSRQWSFLGDASIGYDVAFGHFLVARPKFLVGSMLLFDTVHLGASSQRSRDPLLTVGPGIDLLVPIGGMRAGVDARALFLPARVAAPAGAIYAALDVPL